MGKFVWNKKRAIISIALIAILTATSIGLYQINNNVQAAIISPNPPAGCVGWWRFDEGTGTVASDNSGNGNNGAISGATWVQGQSGEALHFSSNNKVNVPDSSSLELTTGMTLACWIKPDQSWTPSGTAIMPIIGKGANNAQCSYYLGYVQYGYGVAVSINNQAVMVGSGTNIDAGTWYFIVGVYDGSNLKVYVNGVLQNSVAGQTITPNSAALQIAGINSGFGGVVDEVQILNRALSATEIQTNFQSGPGLTSQLTALIPKGTTQVIATLTWQGSGSITPTITYSSQTYTEDTPTVSVYQKTTYSTTSDTSGMLNIKRLSIPVTALPADQSWTIALVLDTVTAYQISVEVQK